MSTEKNHTSVGAALIEEFKQMVKDGRLPNVNLDQFRTPGELADFLKDAIKSGAEAVGLIESSKGSVPHDEDKKAGAFEVAVTHLPETAPVPELTEEEKELQEAVDAAVDDVAEKVDGIEEQYNKLVRTRAFIHGVRDLPDMDKPDHLLSMTNVLNDLEDIARQIAVAVRNLSVLNEAYDLDDGPKTDAIFNQLGSLGDRVMPLIDLFRSKLDELLGEGWDPCHDGEDDEYECECECGGSCNGSCGGDCGQGGPEGPMVPMLAGVPGVLAICIRKVEPDGDSPEGEGDAKPPVEGDVNSEDSGG